MLRVVEHCTWAGMQSHWRGPRHCLQSGWWSALISCSEQQNKGPSDPISFLGPSPCHGHCIASVMHFLNPSSSSYQPARVAFSKLGVMLSTITGEFLAYSMLLFSLVLRFGAGTHQNIRICARLGLCSSGMQTPKPPNTFSLRNNRPTPNVCGPQGKSTNGAPHTMCLNSMKQ